MAILRAGPYGNVSNGVITAHSDGGSGVYPVNCANKNWPNKNWTTSWQRSFQPSSGSPPTTGEAGLGEAVFVRRLTAFVIFNFCYQATSPWNINISWSMTGGLEPVSREITYTYETIDGISSTNLFSINANGSSTVALPATSFGRFRVRVQGFGTRGTGAEVDLNVTLS